MASPITNFFDGINRLRQLPIYKGIGNGKRPQPFLIVGGPRVGSTMLQTLINSHPNAVCMHELLKRDVGVSVFYRHFYGMRKELLRLKESNLEAFIDRVFDLPHPGHIKALGFKALFVHPDLANRARCWKKFQEIENLKVLWLKRNPVRSVISFILAKKDGAWVGRQTKEMIEIDCQYLLRRLAFEDKAGKEARNALSRTSILDLDYEQLVSKSEKHLGEIQNFLGLPIKEVKTSLKRQNNKSLRDTVVNYDELASHINDSQWASYLTESR